MNFNLPITRKTALNKAISLLEQHSNREEEIHKLRLLTTGVPILQWSAEVTKDCIDDFYLENNRLPTVNDTHCGTLPAHTSFKHLFGATASEWLNEYAKYFVVPKTSRKRALKLALELLDGEERQRILEMLDEYPITKWNETNTIDCLVTYFENHHRVPTYDELNLSDELPYFGVFQYKWKMTYLKWIEEKIPGLYQEYIKGKEYHRDYLSDFVCEYQRILPINKVDFDRRRNPDACCCVDQIMSALNITKWRQLVLYCGLELYDERANYMERERAKIKSVNTIIIDCGEDFFVRPYSKEVARRLGLEI